jgi:peptidoglycan/xylan/chitin deacetylase (PgdA/CDA1 family)
VERLLEIAESRSLKFVFAATGFSAEEGISPVNFPDLIREMATKGHEIASHSWKHEWFPHLREDQIRKSLKRSKLILDKASGFEDAVKGFVPPFSRPMTWLKKGAFSWGDRSAFPLYRGCDIQSLTRIASSSNYRWMRISYNPFWYQIRRKKRDRLSMKPEFVNGVLLLPQDYMGFDKNALETVKRGIDLNRDIVISGHPMALSLSKNEAWKYFIPFMDKLLQFRDQNQVKIDTIENRLHGYKNSAIQ